MIPLIHKYAVITLIESLKSEVNDVWPLVKTARVPIYLETSSAQFTSFAAFSKLLEEAYDKLPCATFIPLIQRAGEKFITQILPSNGQKTPLLKHLVELIPVHSITLNKRANACSVELETQQKKTSLCFTELYLLVITHCYCKRIDAHLDAPIKYHLKHPHASELEQLNIDSQTPQFLGQQCTALFYQQTAKLESCLNGTYPMIFDRKQRNYSDQISAVLEGYIGRESLSIEQLSQIIEVNERTIQRYLQAEGNTFREIKESLNIAFAKRVLVDRNASIADVAEHLGYADTSQFIRAFRKSESTTPLQWLKQNQQP
ncbi:helix-turn-helix transcriptional regulator [Motilimonas pumila]|uniref:AraC family transcriptional regulator n=1 Tax=Motilimonas pumila TaxID=2303987 RepID=A0A418YCA4_9GAMM|nr:AraC family transcriptional regulator [Motilimonas pumila]RJG42126.1 AraC family transcriptional regulator [Motilimonas pumila]